MTTSEKVLCRLCGGGYLDSQIKKTTAEYKGVQKELEVMYSVCRACGSEQAAANQLRTNKRVMIQFKKTVDGLLTGKEVREIRERLQLSQTDAARVFGGGPVAFSKYESDDVAQSEAMDKMIRLAGDLPSAFDYLVLRSGFNHKPSGNQRQAV